MGLSGKEIVALKNQKIDIFETINDYIIAYLTDTTIKVFSNSNIFKYKFIMIECTILDEESKDSAKKHMHIYWGDLLPIIKSNPKNHFILIHISNRYNNEEITNFFESEKEKNQINNVEPWINF